MPFIGSDFRFAGCINLPTLALHRSIDIPILLLCPHWPSVDFLAVKRVQFASIHVHVFHTMASLDHQSMRTIGCKQKAQ